MTEAARGSCVELYRVDVSGVSWPIMTCAALFTMLGVCGIGVSFVNHGPLADNHVIPLMGGAFMLAGPLLAVIAMRQLLIHDEYVAALEGGLLVHLDSSELYFAWDALDAVKWDQGTGTVVVSRSEGAPLVIAKKFSRGSPKDMAAQIEDVRRKATFHRR